MLNVKLHYKHQWHGANFPSVSCSNVEIWGRLTQLHLNFHNTIFHSLNMLECTVWKNNICKNIVNSNDLFYHLFKLLYISKCSQRRWTTKSNVISMLLFWIPTKLNYFWNACLRKGEQWKETDIQMSVDFYLWRS